MLFVLIPGAGGDAWYWHRLAPLLQARGHDVVAPDLPAGDDAAGLHDYADAVAAAVGGRTGGVVVGQSMGAITAPLVCERIAAEALVLVAPMILRPGETGGRWWRDSGQTDAQRALDVAAGRDPDAPFDPVATFLHDLPGALLDELLARGERHQSGTPFSEPFPLPAWPAVPTRVVAGRDDRLLPMAFVQRLARERLGVEPEVVDAGHLPALAAPQELADTLLEV